MSAKKNKKRYLNIIFKLPGLLFYPLTLMLVDWASSNPLTVEGFYSTNIYPTISQFISSIFAGFDFSVAEILIYVLVIGIPLGLVIAISYGSQNAHTGYSFFNYIVTLLVSICVVYFIFICIWGLNYYRTPLVYTMGYDEGYGTKDELIELCEDLVDDANSYREALPEDDKGVIKLPYEISTMFNNVNIMYHEMGKDYAVFAGEYSQPKAIWQSEKMCYTEIVGICIPFTMEANINIATPPMSLANIAGHEAAHLRGFSREDEANFISYLVCRDYGDNYFKYSGTILALTHSMNMLYANDADAYNTIRTKYSDAVNRDYLAKYEFWKQYEGEVAEKANEVNNTFLESNNQMDGVKSYGRMVDLLLSERR